MVRHAALKPQYFSDCKSKSFQQYHLIIGYTHYSKSRIFLQKFNFNKKKNPTFSRVFHTTFLWQFFSWNQSCQQLKIPKLQHFHEFSSKTMRHFFLGTQSWFFGLGDFSQRGYMHLLILDHTLILTGDSQGNPAKTGWDVAQGRFTKNKGPFHWFHRYER